MPNQRISNYQIDCGCITCSSVIRDAYAEHERRERIAARDNCKAPCTEVCEQCENDTDDCQCVRCQDCADLLGIDHCDCERCNDCCECSTCADCGARDDTVEYYDTSDGDRPLCEGCIDNYTVEEAGGRWIPLEDAYTCTGCDYTYWIHGDHSRDHSGEIYCDSCANEYLRYCEDTDDLRHYEDCYYSDHDDCYYSEERNGGMHSYSTNPLHVVGPIIGVLGERKPFNTRGSNLLLGVELECDARNGCGEVVDTLLSNTDFEQWGICKSDATVSGPELCLIPADLYTHLNVIAWEQWLDVLRPVARGHFAHAAGMHVHINAAAFSSLTLGKMLVFMNSRQNLPFLSMIAQRDIDANQYCTANPSRFDSVGKSGKCPDTGKFAPLHWKDYTGTAEVRIFRSSLLPERVFKNLEFCDALVRYCEQTSVKHLGAESFAAYVSAERKTYKHLHQFIINRTEG